MSQVRKSMRLLFTVLFFITLACSSVCISPLYAKNTKELVVFGDSLSDTGNLYYVATELRDGPVIPYDPPYWEGRFSNGLVWVEYLADLMDVERPTPSIDGGTNYAWGGAQTGDGFSSVDPRALNIEEQIKSFLDVDYPKDNQLFILWAGANDFFKGLEPLLEGQYIDEEALVEGIVDNILDHIKTLALNSKHKAEKLQFMVANLPPLGQTPKVQWLSLLYPGFDLAGYVDGLSVAFNEILDSELDELKKDLKNKYHITFILYKLDSYSLFQEILDDSESDFTMEEDIPGVYKTVRGAITITDEEGQILLFHYPLDVATTEPEYGYDYDPIVPEESLFFDDMHPTTVAHEFIAHKAYDLIIENEQ